MPHVSGGVTCANKNGISEKNFSAEKVTEIFFGRTQGVFTEGEKHPKTPIWAFLAVFGTPSMWFIFALVRFRNKISDATCKWGCYMCE
jgi:hypothetical protein